MNNLSVAYFTMEIGIRSSMPTYAGGLGMLAGDIMRSCADLGLNVACVTMGWEHGYMQQQIHEDGSQTYSDTEWNKAEYLEKLPQTTTVYIEGREVTVGVWKYNIEGLKGSIPVYFLDTNLEQNTEEDRLITNHLYGGGHNMRIKQEVILGIGGARILQALGYENIGTYHMNEGHAAFLTLELLKERDYNNDAVKKSCAFTTHTPVKAGHDAFDYETTYQVLGEDMLPWHIRDIAGKDALSMTHLAMNLSRYTCGVAQIHGEVSRRMFPGYDIDAITNGVHHMFWACPEMQHVFDTYAPGWREDPRALERECLEFPDDVIWNAHMKAKQRLIDEVNSRGDFGFDPAHLTIATARRVVPYKRPELLYTNLERLSEVCNGKVQIIHAGNAHPNDPFSQSVIQRMIQRGSKLKDSVKIAYLENYNPDLAKKLISGADIWLNTPTRLHEASGTSGMKACLNGVLNLSTLDGWWIEGYGQDNEAGWRIGPLASALPNADEIRQVDAEDLYTQLQFEVIPEYYLRNRTKWITRMKRAIGLLGFFSAQRCTEDYVERAWNGE